MTDRPIIEMAGLKVRYGNLTAVEDLSLEVPQGSVYALLGRNGSGKSSTVRCLLGQQRPTAGTAQVLGLDAWKHRRRIMTEVGVVPETPNMPPEMTAVQLERFLGAVATRWDRGKFFSRIESFGVPLRTRFGRLSKGQQKQLSLSAAVSTSPEILVLDDPTLGLDAVARRELFEELVGELADRGTTVFMTTHDLAGVEGIADRVGILKDGCLLVDEELESLKDRFHRISRLSELQAQVAELPAAASASCGANQLTNSPVRSATENGHEPPALPMTPKPLSLEEIFIALCGPNGGA